MIKWDIVPSNRITRRVVFLTLLAAILLSSCATLFDPESSQEFNSHQIGTINPTTSVGQSVRSSNSQVNGITLWLSKSEQNTDLPLGDITVQIFESSSSESPLFSTSISTSSIQQFTPIQISLPPTTLKSSNYFYIELSASEGEIIVHGRLEDCYSGGQAYQNRQALNADLAFRVTYFYDVDILFQDLIGFTAQIKSLILALAVLLIPGYTIIRILQLNKLFSILEQVALSVGLSLALIPIIYLYTTIVGISITQKWIHVIGILFLLLLIISWVNDQSYRTAISFIKRPIQHIQKNINRTTIKGSVHLLLLLSIIIVVLIIRLVTIRDLATPAWVDSIHHGLITRLIMMNGTLPITYHPYMDIESTLYHPGFHSTLSVFLQLSGMSIYEGMLFFGQVLNAASALAVYLLTVTITRKPTAGLYAALIASTFTAMPAYYTSWGRYPQLAGLIILPIPIALLSYFDLHLEKKTKIKLLLCGAIAISGLFLVHYRVAAFMACLFIAWFITKISLIRSNYKKILYAYIKGFPILILFTLIISSAWLIPAVRDTFLPRLLPTNNEATLHFFSDFSWHYLTPVFGKQVIALAVIGALWALLNRKMMAGTIIGWVALLFFIANLDVLNLPGGSFINNSSVTIMLFMPLSIAAGHLIEQLSVLWMSAFKHRGRNLIALSIIALTVYTGLKGSQQLISILNPTTLLSRQADLTAIQWIDKNIPDNELILINPFAWGYGLFAGSDGGAWIPAIAGNQTMPPPVLYGLGSVTQKAHINEACSEIIRLATAPDELWDYLITININYIYIGARGGPISPDGLSSNPHFETIYHQQNTWLFHVLP